MADAAAAVRAALAAARPGEPEALAVAGAALLRDPWWIAPLLAPWVAALAADPFAEPPLRAARDPLRTSALLVEGERAVLVASVLRAAVLRARPPAATLAASGRVAVTRYHRAGGARLLAWDVGHAGDDFAAGDAAPARALPARALQDGDVIALDGRSSAHLLEDAASDVVMLTAAPRGEGLTREYDRATGRLLRVASNDEAASRTRMMLTLLRLSGRRDAATCFEAATRAPGFHLRWAAMREWLALDVAAALPRLRAMTDDPHAEVRAAARATLLMGEERLCPA